MAGKGPTPNPLIVHLLNVRTFSCVFTSTPHAHPAQVLLIMTAMPTSRL